MIKSALSAGLLVAAASAAHAAPIQWSSASGGNDHYYEIGLSATTWASALAAADAKSYAGLDGYLATITSAAEADFVNSVLLAQQGGITGQSNKDVAWISLTDELVEGTWRWAAGPELGQLATYTEWLPGEPNNAGGNEDYVHITINYADGWNDQNGNISLAYVIEYSQAGGVPLPPAALLLVTGLAVLGYTGWRGKTA